MSTFSYLGELYHQTKDKRLFKLSEIATPHLFNILNSLEPNSPDACVYEEELERRTSSTLRTPITLDKFELTVRFSSKASELVPIKSTVLLDMITALGDSLEHLGLPYTNYSASLTSKENT